MSQKCVHQSCGKAFTDPDEDCFYHPGPPVFHEGQKGWKCCKPRVLTFDEFLSIPPCTKGKHSTTDIPPAIEKAKPDASSTPSRTPAPSFDLPSRAPIAAADVPSSPPTPAPESDSDDASIEIPDGRICRRKACGAKYKKGQDRSSESCVYHPGAPLFHEGSKGYTCCKRRVLEFDEFMRIEGCETKPKHLFIGSGKRKGGSAKREVNGEEVVETIRHDFYQTPSTIIASFFLKKIDKDKASVVFSSPTTLALDLPTTDAPPKRYKDILELYGEIDTKESTFKIMGTKLEVTMVRVGGAWPVLKADERRTGEIIQVGKAGRAM